MRFWIKNDVKNHVNFDTSLQSCSVRRPSTMSVSPAREHDFHKIAFFDGVFKTVETMLENMRFSVKKRLSFALENDLFFNIDFFTNNHRFGTRFGVGFGSQNEAKN